MSYTFIIKNASPLNLISIKMRNGISEMEGYHRKHTYVCIFQKNKNVYLYMFPPPRHPSLDTLLISCSIPLDEIKFIPPGYL